MQHLAAALEEIQAMESKIRQLKGEAAKKDGIIAALKGRKSTRNVRFDEETIAEHDKERGTRMKIDEPKTPYVRENPFDFPDDDRVSGTLSASRVRVSVATDSSVVGASVPKKEKTLVVNDVPDSDDSDEDIPIVAHSSDVLPAAPQPLLSRPVKLDLGLLNTKLETVQKHNE